MHSVFGRQGKERTVFKGSPGRESYGDTRTLTKSSIAGYSAITGKIVNIKDAYADLELKFIDRDLCFDMRWDKESGYRTKSVLAMPVPVKAEGNIIGVFQALNKVDGFSDSDVTAVKHLSYLLGIALTSVYVVGADGVARLRWIKAGRRFDQQLEILSGVNVGERVLMDGSRASTVRPC